MSSRRAVPSQPYTGTRPGGRSARVRRAVLDAAGQILLAGGVEALTVPAVASAAGVHHATIYRRWPTRARLVLDTILDLSASGLPVPAAGGSTTARADLIAYFRAVAAGLQDSQIQAVVRGLLALPEDEVAEERREYWRARFAVATSIVESGIACGEFPADLDPPHVVELIAGPIWLRTIVTGAGVDDKHVERLVDEALRAPGGSERSSQRPRASRAVGYALIGTEAGGA